MTLNTKLEQKLVDFLNQNFSLQERIRSFEEKKIHTLEIELTDACNLSCIYCYAEDGTKGQLSLEKARDVLKQAKDYAIKEIWWLGGEPLLNPRWFEIIKYSKELGLVNLLFTNGTKLDKENSEKIAQVCDYFILHLDTIDPVIFPLLQQNQRKDTHKGILEGFERLLEQGFPPEKIRLNLTLTRTSYTDLEETMNYFINDKGIQTITLIPLYFCGRGRTLPSSEFLDTSELYKAFKKRSQIEGRPELMFLGSSEFCKHYQLTNAYIKSNGDITPYAGIDICVGNIHHDDLRNVLTESFETLSFAKLVSSDGKTNYIDGKCGICENSKYCFGTRTAIYNVTGDISKSDPTCWKLEPTTREPGK